VLIAPAPKLLSALPKRLRHRLPAPPRELTTLSLPTAAGRAAR
jgi:hypothetical protein